MIDTIYIERTIEKHPRVQKLISRFKNADKIFIDRYGEVFNKRNQSFRLQKSSPALILAHKKKGHVLRAPDGFGIGGTKNYYFSHMYNCVYDCRYCFLQGMYSSANYVLFVNFEDFNAHITELIRNSGGEQLTFFSGYDCDSLALENITGFVSQILPFFENYPTALLEIRTKSIQIRQILSNPPIQNCVIAYSLMPQVMANILDKKTPSITQRIETLCKLTEHGWKIGLRFDPLIYGKNWKEHYKNLLEQVFSTIPKKYIHSVSYGPLRFPKAMFKSIEKMYPQDPLFSGPLSLRNGIVSYDRLIEDEMADYCIKMTQKYVPQTMIFRCMSIEQSQELEN